MYVTKYRPLTVEERQQISTSLSKRKALLKCPRCGQVEFEIIDGIFHHPLYSPDSDPNVLVASDTFIQTVGVICTNCGFLSHHVVERLIR
jgi:hypothetical protein